MNPGRGGAYFEVHVNLDVGTGEGAPPAARASVKLSARPSMGLCSVRPSVRVRRPSTRPPVRPFHPSAVRLSIHCPPSARPSVCRAPALPSIRPPFRPSSRFPVRLSNQPTKFQHVAKGNVAMCIGIHIELIASQSLQECDPY